MGWFFGTKKEKCPFKEECMTRDTKYEYIKKMEFGKKSHASFGQINIAKIRGNEKNDVIIKVQDISKPNKERVFWNEVMLINRMTQRMPELGPGFIDAWVCDNKGYIAMENWLEGYEGGSLKDFDFKAYPKDAQISLTLFLLKLYKRLHSKAQIFHDDIRAPNILFRRIGESVRFAIIDFGLSEDLTNKDEYPTKKEILKSIMSDYINLIELVLDMGGDVAKYADFKYGKKSRTYCVFSNKLDDLDPQIKDFVITTMNEYSPKINKEEFYKKQVDKFNARNIRRRIYVRGKCKRMEQPAGKDPAVEEAAQKLGID